MVSPHAVCCHEHCPIEQCRYENRQQIVLSTAKLRPNITEPPSDKNDMNFYLRFSMENQISVNNSKTISHVPNEKQGLGSLESLTAVFKQTTVTSLLPDTSS
jgi:hypothetical protein